MAKATWNAVRLKRFKRHHIPKNLALSTACNFLLAHNLSVIAVLAAPSSLILCSALVFF